MRKQTRRDFVTSVAAGMGATLMVPPSATGAPSQDDWGQGVVDHLLATASHERILLKASFRRPLSSPPTLRIGSRLREGRRTDTTGDFWSFDVAGLDAERRYTLELLGADARPLCDPWPLTTFPEPTAARGHFRLMIYTCAGGHDTTRDPDTGGPFWVSVANRRKMLKAGLSYAPHAVIAVGDHVYWDLRAGRAAQMLGASPVAQRLVGSFDRSAPVLGTDNERKLHLAVRSQIADLYGTLFRSTPVFFVQDDHDYFENDVAREDIVTFPPDDFMLRLARATQQLYYPEFLPDRYRPMGLPGAGAADRPLGVSEAFGTLRFGKLLEIMIYDCRRFVTLEGPSAVFVPNTVEAWLTARMAAHETNHVVNLPSTPIAWGAGKWAEWYPDVLQPDGTLGTSAAKYFWQEGWNAQHDRLLRAAYEMSGIPLFLSGDLHAIAEGKIVRNGRMDLRRNPIISVLTGPISTGPAGWPSAFRGVSAQVPTQLDVEEGLRPLEKNGFSILDFTPDAVDIKFFGWKMGEPEERLDDMQPFHTVRFERVV